MLNPPSSWSLKILKKIQAGKLEEGCCDPKVSLFAVNSRYGVFEEKKVPRTEGEGEKRNFQKVQFSRKLQVFS